MDTGDAKPVLGPELIGIEEGLKDRMKLIEDFPSSEDTIGNNRRSIEDEYPMLPPPSKINFPGAKPASSNNESGTLIGNPMSLDAQDSKGCWGTGGSSGESSGNYVTPSGGVAMPVHMDSEVYNMNHPKRGRAIIFNHENFLPALDLGRRHGTEKDKQNLKTTLKNLGFDVKCHDDLTYVDVVREIEQLAKEDHSAHDCLMIAILSHGDTNIMYAKDYSYKPDLLWMSFTADKVPTLAGKPKIFFVQACQGNQLDEGTKLVKVNRTEVDSSPQSYRIPNHADFLIVYSTFPGHYAWRNTTNGSWFVQAVCTVLQKYANKKDLLAMMTVVSREVALKFESNTPSLPHMHQKKQIPFVTSTLIRDVYLVPK